MAKPILSSLVIVTATVDPVRALPCIDSWRHQAQYEYWIDLVDGRDKSVVQAFAEGVHHAFADKETEAVLCLHDDVLIEEQGWDRRILDALDRGVKFAGFGGAVTLGAENIYRLPYDPMQLARGGFVSNMRDAEAHGRRSTIQQPCVCFDGFSQLGTKDWFDDAWQELVRLGFRHHFYDGALGCLARRVGIRYGELLPVACHHYGGVTAVADPAYQAWAKTQHPDGDQGFWAESHRIGYEAFRNELPLRLTR